MNCRQRLKARRITDLIIVGEPPLHNRFLGEQYPERIGRQPDQPRAGIHAALFQCGREAATDQAPKLGTEFAYSIEPFRPAPLQLGPS